MSRAGRIHRAPLAIAGLMTAVIGVGGGAGVYLAADRQDDALERNQAVAAVLDIQNDGPAENFLIVGSDSREGLEEAADAPGTRSDSIMILRRDPDNGAALLSIPRDLWVPIAGRGDEWKINAAFNGGADRLVQTIQNALGIPIHHYIEVDFDGFARMVDTFGGVEICVEYAARDQGSGLDIQPGCQTLNGGMALAFVRSRHYTEWIDGEWVEDNKNDFGRMERQQLFLRTAATALLDELRSNPLILGDLLDAATQLITVDPNLDLYSAAGSIRAAFQDGLATFSLPAEQAWHGDQNALDLIEDQAEPILQYFRGAGALPDEAADGTAAANSEST
jgi:LCP family protein required for cell wall assembly